MSFNELVGVHLVELTEVDEETASSPSSATALRLSRFSLRSVGSLPLSSVLLNRLFALIVVEHTGETP